ncbi:glycosyltransferase family 4 protein [Thalassobacillus sp. C254]|uniref:glycosyltransferase family 4 protein n=1 Tax=Thalassobacillus sp. C254 TaxID=1225341 RepID=UPI0006D16043|nr:glycosyltransferase family 4 protein [Thalassobacillus sp. C254]
MKVLYVTARSPYPPHKGDQLIAYEQIKKLAASSVKVYLISFVSSEGEEKELREEVGDCCEAIYTLSIRKSTQIRNLANSLTNKKPFQVNLNTNTFIKTKLDNIVETVSPDLIHVQTVRIADYFLDTDIPKVVDMIDALSLNMKRRAEKEKFPLKQVCRIESKLLRAYEERVLSEYSKALLVSESDTKAFPQANITVNPNGTYITKEYLQNYETIKREKIILFHGNMGYFPNVEAMTVFVKEIWPRIHGKYPDYKLYIVGKSPSSKIQSFHGQQNIVVTGFVEEVCEYLKKAAIGVYPMYSGTGMQNKILEALACGLPSVATPLALQGIKGISDREVIKVTNNDELCRSIDNLIQEDLVRRELSKKGQDFIFRNYSWEKNVDTLIKVWEKAASKNVDNDSVLKKEALYL